MGKRVIYSLTPNRTTQALNNVELAAAGKSIFYAFSKILALVSSPRPQRLIYVDFIRHQVSSRPYLRPSLRVPLSVSRSSSRSRDKVRVPDRPIRDRSTSSGSCTRKEG
jgi:hypothetical protein